MGPLRHGREFPANNLIAAMHSDKKTRDGKLRFVLTPRIGNAHRTTAFPCRLSRASCRCPAILL